MSVLLSLSDSHLSLAVVCQVLTQRIGNALFLESNQLVCDGLVVIGETYIDKI